MPILPQVRFGRKPWRFSPWEKYDKIQGDLLGEVTVMSIEKAPLHFGADVSPRLKTAVSALRGVGPARVKALSKLGITTLGDFIRFYPRTYEDRTRLSPIAALVPGVSVCITAMVAAQPRLHRVRSGRDLVKVRVVDDSGSLDITFFNRAYVKNQLQPGNTYIFYGEVTGSAKRPEMINPIFEPADKPRATGRLVPVYPLSAGLNQTFMASCARSALDALGDTPKDPLPLDVLQTFQLASLRFALENIHFPTSAEALDIARRRLVFEELFIFSSALAYLRRGRKKAEGRALGEHNLEEFFSKLPFTLTNAQKRAISEATEDMRRGVPMSRLVQGDVGSGKTVVAAACCWYAWKSGCQSAFMAPTEILAAQHEKTLWHLLEPHGMRVALLTGSLPAKRKRTVLEQLQLGEVDVVVGTHALISEGVNFFDLSLVITDEQHRFGVGQRSALSRKGEHPHVLVMSATPIPRTLALILYGDLDISVIDELPPGRTPVETYAVDERMRERIYNFVRRLVSEGRQVYIVCPMVEESNTADLDLKSVKEYAEQLKNNVFPDLAVGLVHGKLRPGEKEAVMSAFASGELNILVATTVIEVGVDVPNATLMIIENADRFGLSQLHQLRGRVGRGQHQSYCVLFEGGGGEVARQRMKILTETNDGFKIAEEDLRLRGPGDFFGARQHGLPGLRIASLATDMSSLSLAQRAAHELIERDPMLSSPEHAGLRDAIENLMHTTADTLN